MDRTHSPARDGHPGEARTRVWERPLGAASVALGAPLLGAPGAVARLVGLRATPTEILVLRAVGARELAVAGPLLALGRRWALWTRVAGDVVDLALVGRALVGRTWRDPARLLGAAGALGAIGAIDLAAAVLAPRRPGPLDVSASVTVNCPRDAVYGFWRHPERLAGVLGAVESVEEAPRAWARWRERDGRGVVREWDAELVEDVPGDRLVWRSVEGATVRREGSVHLADAPGGRGTEVRVHLAATGEPPAGTLGDDLRRLKQVLETGEVARSDGAPAGAGRGRPFPQRPAQPLSDQDRRGATGSEVAR